MIHTISLVHCFRYTGGWVNGKINGKGASPHIFTVGSCCALPRHGLPTLSYRLLTPDRRLECPCQLTYCCHPLTQVPSCWPAATPTPATGRTATATAWASTATGGTLAVHPVSFHVTYSSTEVTADNCLFPSCTSCISLNELIICCTRLFIYSDGDEFEGEWRNDERDRILKRNVTSLLGRISL
jgi:hypothetical protein